MSSIWDCKSHGHVIGSISGIAVENKVSAVTSRCRQAWLSAQPLAQALAWHCMQSCEPGAGGSLSQRPCFHRRSEVSPLVHLICLEFLSPWSYFPSTHLKVILPSFVYWHKPPPALPEIRPHPSLKKRDRDLEKPPFPSLIPGALSLIVKVALGTWGVCEGVGSGRLSLERALSGLPAC